MTDSSAVDNKQLATQGITEPDWQLWRHHPVSKVFLKYLADKRAYLERTVLDQWIDGGLTLVADQTIRGQLIELNEIENLPFDAIFHFYYQGEDEVNGTEATQDESR